MDTNTKNTLCSVQLVQGNLSNLNRRSCALNDACSLDNAVFHGYLHFPQRFIVKREGIFERQIIFLIVYLEVEAMKETELVPPRVLY